MGPAKPRLEGEEQDEWLVELGATLGVSEAETRVYEYLLTSGEITPAKVARDTGHSRPAVYRILRRLAEAGVVRELATRPIRYAPIPIAETLQVAIERARIRTNILEQAAGRPRSAGVHEAEGPEPLKPRDVAVVVGRRAVMAEIQRIVILARTEIVIWGAGQLAGRLASTRHLLRDLRAASERQVKVRLYLARDGGSEEARARIRAELGDCVVLVPPEGCPLPNLAFNEATVLEAYPHPDNPSTTHGMDLGLRVAGAAAVEQARRMLAWASKAGAWREPSAP